MVGILPLLLFSHHSNFSANAVYMSLLLTIRAFLADRLLSAQITILQFYARIMAPQQFPRLHADRDHDDEWEMESFAVRHPNFIEPRYSRTKERWRHFSFDEILEMADPRVGCVPSESPKEAALLKKMQLGVLPDKYYDDDDYPPGKRIKISKNEETCAQRDSKTTQDKTSAQDRKASEVRINIPSQKVPVG
jgi:hypothetical protein